MIKEEIERVVYISVALAAVLTLAYLIKVTTKEIELINVYRGVSLSITLVTFFWTFYFSYGWKICIMKHIFYRPNLNGTWKGTLTSDWKNDEGQGVPPMDFFIVIRQSFLRIHFTTFTKDFIGISYAETLTLDKSTGVKTVAYLYRKDTSQLSEDPLREGASELRLILSNKPKELEGKYWSNTKTQGTIAVKFISCEHVDSYASAQKLTSS